MTAEKESSEIALTTLRKLFRAAQDVKNALTVSEDSFNALAPEAHPEPRDLFTFEALDEVQKMVCALLPLAETYSSADEADGPVANDDATTRIIKEGLGDHSALWQRKLAEILAELVAFRSTNEAVYFRDYILLARLDQVLSAQADQRTFWGAESANLAHQITDLQGRLRGLEADLDFERAWYRFEERALRDDPRPGRLFAGFSQRLHRALGEGSDAEKVALGLSYGAIFGRTSESLHGRPGRMERHARGSMMGDLRVPVLIAMNVLVACQKLLDQVPGEHNEFFKRALENNADATRQLGRLTEERAALGDLVFAHGELCEVLDVATGPYGYKTYKVRYLTRRLIPDIGEDHVVAPQVAVILNVERARTMLMQQVEQGRIPPEIAEQMVALPDEQLIAAFRESTVQLWNASVGLKESITARLTRSD